MTDLRSAAATLLALARERGAVMFKFPQNQHYLAACEMVAALREAGLSDDELMMLVVATRQWGDDMARKTMLAALGVSDTTPH